ncbi:hypothetical protein B296_00044200 [Ensete ventricosum]|uniref:Uncharacterized protein n=1 Tax=Ensete ventricosum TaxID=4639 RepID=A0A426XDN5_ENSVE|nr:hypothetical protein B296_00044200 [Ensete ventricosum]
MSKMGQAGPLPQAVVGGLQVQTRWQTTGVAHEERESEHDECEVGYSLRAEEAQSGAPTGKGATRRDYQRWKPASMLLKRAWRNSTKAKEDSLG